MDLEGSPVGGGGVGFGGGDTGTSERNKEILSYCIVELSALCKR